ncbi:Mitochondrial zinc maintenance protein 1, mitochondrial [Xanthoria parietina]
MATSAYRNLLRSARVAFQDDTRVLASALATARSTFDSSRSIIPNSSEARAAIAHAEEVAGILRRNVVQGKGNGEDTFHLRMHDEIERGDNDTIKFARTGIAGSTADVGCCGGASGGK